MSNYNTFLYLEFYDLDCDPEQITVDLNLHPNWTGKKGEPWQIPGRPKNDKRLYPSSFWKYRLVDESDFEFRELLDELIKILKPVSDILKELSEKHRGQLLFVTYSGDNNPGFGFSDDQLRFIAEHRLSVYFDIYSSK